jgi:hypothetical protein
MKPAMRFSLREVFVVIGVVAVACWSVWRVREAEKAFDAQLAEQQRLFRAQVEALQQTRVRSAAQRQFDREYRVWSENPIPLDIVWPPIREPGRSPPDPAPVSPWEVNQQPGF